LVNSNLTLYGRVAHTVKAQTAINFRGPVTPNQNITGAGPIISTLQLSSLSGVIQSGFVFVNASKTIRQLDILNTYYEITSTYFTGGEIRGPLYPLLTSRRRKVPHTILEDIGQYAGRLEQIYRLNHIGANIKRYIAKLVVTLYPAVSSSGNTTTHEYSSIFKYKFAISKRNFDGVRGMRFETNLYGFGETWNFEVYNYQNKNFTTIGTFSKANFWSYGSIPLFSSAVRSYFDADGILQLRVSSSNTSSPLHVDLCTFRTYQPPSLTHQTLRLDMKSLLSLTTGEST